MPSIYLLRHCAYDNPLNILPGRLPVELSAAGKENAARLAKFWKPKVKATSEQTKEKL